MYLKVAPCLTSRTSPGGLFSHRPKQWLPLAHRMVVFSGETRPSPRATRSISHCSCWSVKAHSLSSPCAAVKRQKELELCGGNKVNNTVGWHSKMEAVCVSVVKREDNTLDVMHLHIIDFIYFCLLNQLQRQIDMFTVSVYTRRIHSWKTAVWLVRGSHLRRQSSIAI